MAEEEIELHALRKQYELRQARINRKREREELILKLQEQDRLLNDENSQQSGEDGEKEEERINQSYQQVRAEQTCKNTMGMRTQSIGGSDYTKQTKHAIQIVNTKHAKHTQKEDKTSPQNVDMATLQKKAQQLVEQKMQSRVRLTKNADTSQNKVTEVWDNTQEAGPSRVYGVEHLKRLELIPSTAGRNYGDKLQGEGQDMEQDQQSQAGNYNNPLHAIHKFDYGWNCSTCGDNEGGRNLMTCNNCSGAKPKVKSGKYAKNSAGIVKQELWPHNAVSRKYAKRVSFDNMNYKTYVAGEVKIIYSMCQRNLGEALGRMRVLMLMAHWMCKSRDWQLL